MRSEDARAIRRMMAKAEAKMAGIATRAAVSGTSTGPNGATVTARLLQGEVHSASEYFEPYGVSGAVPNSSEGIALAVGASKDQVAVMCASPRGQEPIGKLAGEVDYWAIHGQRIRHHTGGDTSVLPGPTGAVYLGTDVDPLAPAAARNGDSVPPSGGMTAWMAALTATVNGLAPGSIPVPPSSLGSILATSTSVKIGD